MWNHRATSNRQAQPASSASDLLWVSAARVAAQVDRVAASARGLAADGAVAVHEGNGRIGLQAELDCAAMAGAFQLHMPSG